MNLKCEICKNSEHPRGAKYCKICGTKLKKSGGKNK